MIASLEGVVRLIGENFVVINVDGVGYKVFVTPRVLEKARLGESLAVWTHQHVREDSLDLFGFLTTMELETFQKLISVSGVGPKTGLGILAVCTPEHLATAVASGNVSLLTKVSGIGKKTAERLLVELKGSLIYALPDSGSATRPFVSGDLEVIEALESLGYSVADARSALEQVNEETTDTNDRLKATLKLLGRDTRK